MKLTNNKNKLDSLTTMTQELLHKIKLRKLDEFFAIEDGIIESQKIDKKILSSLILEKGFFNFFKKKKVLFDKLILKEN
jgi:hypothetical protein